MFLRGLRGSEGSERSKHKRESFGWLSQYAKELEQKLNELRVHSEINLHFIVSSLKCEVISERTLSRHSLFN